MQDNESLFQEYQLTLQELGSAATSNERRRQLLEYLPRFDSISSPEFLCNVLLSESSDLSVIMFSLAKLEACIMKELPLGESQNRRRLFQTVFHLSQSFEATGKPGCTVQKLMSIAASITRHSDDADAAEYFNKLFELIGCKESRSFALKFLQISIEEFVESDRCRTLPYERLQHMKMFGIQQASRFYGAVIGLMSQNLQPFLMCSYPAKSTPTGLNIASVLTQFMAVLKSTGNRYADVVKQNFDEFTSELSCLSTLVKAVDADSLLEGHCLHLIYMLAFVGLQLTVQPIDEACFGISELAVNCLQQLSERQWSKKSVEDSEMVEFLTAVFSTVETTPHSLDVPHFHCALRLLHQYAVYFYAKQMDCIATFHAFFHSQLICTLKLQQAATCRMFCDCWASMLESVVLRMEIDSHKCGIQETSYLPEGFCRAFGSTLLGKLVNFEAAYEENEPTDSVELFDSGSLPGCCLEILALLARVDMDSQWQVVTAEYDRIAEAVRHSIVSVFDGDVADSFCQMDSRDVAHILTEMRQFRYILKAMCGFASLFHSGNYKRYFEMCHAFFKNHCELTVLFTRTFFCKPTSTLGIFEEPIALAMAMVLLCFQAYAHWLSNFYAEAQQSGNRNEEVSLLVSTSLNAVTTVLRDAQASVPLTRAAVLTLRSILLTVRPHIFVLSMNGVQNLYQQSIDGRYRCLPDDVQRVLYVSLANYLILPWYNAVGDEQEWAQRRPMYQQLVRSILSDYFALVETEQVTPCDIGARIITKATPLVVALLESIENESTVTKRACYDVIRPLGKGTLSLLPLYTKNLNCAQSLLLLLSHLLRTLITQFGVDFTKQLSSTLLTVCNSCEFSGSLCSGNDKTVSVLECFISVLSTIVVQTSRKFSCLLSEVITLAIGPLFNVLCMSDMEEVKRSYYELLGKIVSARWRHYLPTLSSALNAAEEEELRTFVAIFCGGIITEEAETAKAAIAQLNLLNTKHSFYTREAFLHAFYDEFVSILFMALIDREHDILLDDICDTLALVACPDLARFCSNRLPAMIETNCGLSREQALELCGRLLNCKEVPTFSVTLKGVVHDTIFCRLLNSVTTA